MASPLQTGKPTVDLAARARGSRIRRDPPPPERKLDLRDPEEVEQRNAIVGIAVFAAAIFVIVLAIAMAGGWSPGDYTIYVAQ